MDGEIRRNQKLYAMANQIADNLVHGRTEQETVEEVASHIRRFWSRDMKQSLFAAIGDEALNPIVTKAAGKLAEEYR